MHDINDFEVRGIPAVFVATNQFVDAAAAQSATLGCSAAARVFTPHPVQDRTDAELIAYADDAFNQLVAALVAEPFD